MKLGFVRVAGEDLSRGLDLAWLRPGSRKIREVLRKTLSTR